jgi:hypothetical protein
MSGRFALAVLAAVVASGCNLVLGIVELGNEGLPPPAGGAGSGGAGGELEGGGPPLGGAGGGEIGGSGGGAIDCGVAGPAVVWGGRIGSPGDVDTVTDVAIGPEGVTAIVGDLEQAGDLAIGTGTAVPLAAGVFVSVQDSAGATLSGFPQPLPGSNPRVIVLGEKLFVAASFEDDIILGGEPHEGPGAYVVRLSASGDVVFKRTLLGTPASTLTITGLAGSTDGRLVVAGNFRGSVAFEGVTTLASEVDAERDAFVLEYPDLGVPWVESYSGGSGSNTSVNAVALAANGDIIITGRRQGATQFGSSTPVQGGPGMYVARLRSTGDELADGLPLYLAQGGIGRSLSATSDGGVIVAGVTQSMSIELPSSSGAVPVAQNTPFLIAMNGEHEATYARAIEGASNTAIDVAAVGDDVLVVGSYANQASLVAQCPLDAAAGLDGFGALLRLADGSLVWQRSFGGRLDDGGIVVAGNETGLAIGGFFNGSVSVDGVSLESAGGNDGFLLRSPTVR